MLQAREQWQQARLSRDRRFDGRFFVAVKTTGIFCRNICPANLPKEENVEYYSHAVQAMQRGYRPCLRCRPDSAPNSFAWMGVDTTVVRAMRLLRDNPQLAQEQLVQKLGVSDGYLRRLFRERVGISPKQYQLGEQLLLAKKLLHETDLTVEQIAQSAGFQSARRLQHHFKAMLKLTPTQIRHQPSNRGKTLHLYLSYRPPYCWSQVRDFWQVRAVAGMEWVEPDSYSRSFSWLGTKGWFRATIEPEKYRFAVELTLDDYSRLPGVLQNIRRILDLDTDFDVLARGLLKSGLPQSQITDGLRLPGVWSLFEAGCRAILGQQVSVKAAVNKVAQLTEALGERQPFSEHLKLHFPTPEAVAASDLAFLKMPQARRAALRSLAQYLVDDVSSDDADPQQWLDIKGIGPWTVAYAQMRGQSEPDIWLGTDLVIKKQIQQHQLQTDNAAPWRSYLTFQLWHHA